MGTTIAVVLLGAVALVLFTPVEVAFRCERRPSLRCHFRLRMLNGLISKEIESERRDAERAAAPVAKDKRGGRRGRSRRPAHVTAMLTTRGFPSGVVRLVGRLVHAFRVPDFHVWLRVGLDDPADTGLLSAWLMPAAAYLQAQQPGRWDVAPVFVTRTLAFAARGRISVTPARLLWPVLAFGFSPSTVRGLIALRTGRAR